MRNATGTLVTPGRAKSGAYNATICHQRQGWWMSDKKLSNFWAHYYASKRWMNTHRKACQLSNITSEFSNFEHKAQQHTDVRRPTTVTPRLDPNSSKLPNLSNENDERQASNVNSVSKRNLEMQSPLQESFRSCETQSGEEVEMSDEMIDFFRQTIEHRQKRDKARKQEVSQKDWLGNDECDEYITADQIGVDGIRWRTIATPNTHELRRKELEKMSLLYGVDAEKILAMEAHLQSRFEQQYSLTTAPLWPNIPIKF